MKRAAIRSAHLRQAILAYLPIAYPNGVPASVAVPKWVANGPNPRATASGDWLRLVMNDETRTSGLSPAVPESDTAYDTPGAAPGSAGESGTTATIGTKQFTRCARYTLRLGNARYPHMKLVLQEFVESDEFVFGVDAHDQLPIDPASPEFDAWERLRDYNAWIRHRIEQRFQYVGLETMATALDHLPLHDDAPALTESDEPRRILVVDDDPDFGRAAEAVLTSAGFTVIRALDGAEALELMVAERIDLVVMDYLMPNLCGGDACDQIKRDPRWRDVPILLATTTPRELIAPNAADEFLVKPFHRRVLIHHVRHLLGL